MTNTATYTEQEIRQRQKKQRTILNWKKQFDVRIPIEYFEEFKLNKAHYLACAKLNPEIAAMFLQKDDGLPKNIIIQKHLEIIQ